MSAPSLFRRVGKYAPSHVVDPRENRLTECLAAVLERVDGLGAWLVAGWLEEAPRDGELHVRTQRSTISGKFVDLDLRFSGEKPLLVWVEIKHGAELHGDQLESYAADIVVETTHESRLVLLAPRQSMPPAPDGVVSVEWQEVGRQLRAFSGRDGIEEKDRWLIGELHDYLKEEGLSDQDAFSPATVFALSAFPAAERTLARLNEIADGYVRAGWGAPPKGFLKRSGSQQPNYGVGWWISFPLPGNEDDKSPWGKAWLEWGVRPDTAREDGRDGLAFFAGATFPTKSNPMFSAKTQPWLAELSDRGFERVQDWYWRLWRYRYPEELMAAPTLENQARVLADWVLESFSTLAGSPPQA
jgi:hypothetical protein